MKKAPTLGNDTAPGDTIKYSKGAHNDYDTLSVMADKYENTKPDAKVRATWECRWYNKRTHSKV